jgi:ribosome-associated protein
MEDLPVNERLTIPAGELRVSFARSGGPGGQNVNKVETKVEIRWRPEESSALAGGDRGWLLSRLAHRLTAAGDLVVTSSRTRDQNRNREDARAKLAAMVARAAAPPAVRKRTKPSRAAVEKRLREKRERSGVKLDRGESRYPPVE